MLKSKRWLCGFLIFLVLLFGACGGQTSLPPTSSDNTRLINYKYITAEGAIKDVSSFMYDKGSAYPTSYEVGEEITIPALLNYRKNDTLIYAFYGWFYDTEYKNEFLGGVPNCTDTALTLYAKIVEREKLQGEIVTASITYSWEIFNQEKTGVDSFPSEMVAGLTLPTEYIEGQSIHIPNLNNYQESSKVIYKFEGWFYDNELLNKVPDNTLADSIGNIILYASISVWVG